MQVCVFTLGFDPVSKQFDDTAVRDFLADKPSQAQRETRDDQP
ncbi:hypothetical protein [Rhabdochromatium marinum]|nr:hypothetical protein [Rhabdochromatium marinum]